MILNSRAYLTLNETKEWLNIKLTDTSKDNQIIRHINTACARVEQFIEAPVLNTEYVEYSDGNNSNVIMPTKYPLVDIVEIKIDFNRAFDGADPLDAHNYVIRGIPPETQALLPTMTNGQIAILGSDIVLRDDSNVAILGRIFAGSVIQSIKLTYKAGRGETADDLPEDLRTATLMLAEYLYILKENRELGVSSKGVMGQSYSKKEVGISGMPMEVEAMLQEYRDYAFPPVSMPQRNHFKV